MINTRAHAIVDYVMAIVLAGSPWVFGFSSRGPAYGCCLIAAVVITISAFICRFEMSIAKLVPLRAHLWLDMITGVLLALSPFIWKFDENVFKPHLVFGLSLLIVALLTDRIPHEKIKNKL